MYFDVLGPGDEYFCIVVSADFVGDFEGFCYFELGEKGVLLFPGAGFCFPFEDNGDYKVILLSFGEGVHC